MCIKPPPPDASNSDTKQANSDATKNSDPVNSEQQWYSSTMSFFNLEVAPLLLPIQRRLQTFAAFYFLATFLFLGISTFILLACMVFYPGFNLVPLMYIGWWLYDLDTCNQGGRRGWMVHWARRWKIWKYYADYFPIKLIKTAQLDPSKNYLICSHPHGILCFGAVGAFLTEGCGFSESFPGINPHLLTVEGQFWWPGCREFLMLGGACSVSKRSIAHLLGRPGGEAPVLVVGGVCEIINNVTSEIKLCLAKRKGFIKLALLHGTSLVPTFSFGETLIYNSVPGSFVDKFQHFVESFIGFAPVMFLGRGLLQYKFGILPHRKPINVVMGEPIPVTKNSSPSSDEIEELHEKYVDSLIFLYNKYKSIYGDPNTKLIIN